MAALGEQIASVDILLTIGIQPSLSARYTGVVRMKEVSNVEGWNQKERDSVDLRRGLNATEVLARRRAFGSNVLPAARRNSPALQALDFSAGRLGDCISKFGLAAAGRSFEQNWLIESGGQMHNRGGYLVSDVTNSSQSLAGLSWG